MKSLLIILSIILITLSSVMADQTLTLTWIQPPGYTSALYESTNLNGGWTSLGIVNPPVVTQPTNQLTFFYVSVAPAVQINPPVIYNLDPNGEGLTPLYTNAPAIAYDDNGSIGTYVWSIKHQEWR